MSTPRNDGGPAFPTLHKEPREYGEGCHEWTVYGVTKRDWFATHASEEDIVSWINTIYERDKQTATREMARYAYADAMLAERQRDR